jgi:hypothetical protein
MNTEYATSRCEQLQQILANGIGQNQTCRPHGKAPAGELPTGREITDSRCDIRQVTARILARPNR